MAVNLQEQKMNQFNAMLNALNRNSFGGGGSAVGGVAVGTPFKPRRPGGPYQEDVETDPQGRQFYQDYTGRRVYLPDKSGSERFQSSLDTLGQRQHELALARAGQPAAPAAPTAAAPATAGRQPYYNEFGEPTWQAPRPTFQPPAPPAAAGTPGNPFPWEIPPTRTDNRLEDLAVAQAAGAGFEDLNAPRYRDLRRLTHDDLVDAGGATTTTTRAGTTARERAPEDPRIQQLINALMVNDYDPELESLTSRLRAPSRVRPMDTSGGSIDITGDPEARAYRVRRVREAERQRRALAERMAAGGVTGSGAFDVGVGQVGEESARDISGFEAGLVGRRREQNIAGERARFEGDLARESQERAGYADLINSIMSRLNSQRTSRTAALQALLQRQAYA